MSTNPYATPVASLDKPDATGLRRIGKVVVVPTGYHLPDRCITCNAPATTFKTKKVVWHHPAVFLAILLNILVYIILALLVRKSQEVTAGLCEQHRRRRFNLALTGWTLFGAGSIALVLGGMQNWDFSPAIGLLLYLGAAVAGGINGRLLYATKIGDYEARVGGFGKPFLDSLPHQ